MRLLITLIILFFSFVFIVNATVVKLRWDNNTETDLAGYNVYMRRNTNVQYGKIGTTSVNTYATDNIEHPLGSYLYFVVTAFNTGGLESDYSNVVSVFRPTFPNIAVPKLISRP